MKVIIAISKVSPYNRDNKSQQQSLNLVLQNEPSTIWDGLKSFFDIQHVKDTLTVAFKKGPNNRRKKSILVLTSIAFIYGPAYGKFNL